MQVNVPQAYAARKVAAVLLPMAAEHLAAVVVHSVAVAVAVVAAGGEPKQKMMRRIHALEIKDQGGKAHVAT